MADPSTPLDATKTALRQAALSRRGALSPAERAQAALALAAHAMAWLQDAPPANRLVAGYHALKGEIDPAPLLATLAAAGYALALPRMVAEGLAFHAYRAGDPLEKGAFGVEEPLASAPRVQPGIILAPLVAFDRRGHRLGYGKGFYDRAFAAHPAALGVGLAFAVQEVARVPDEPHDRALAAIITESGIIAPR